MTQIAVIFQLRVLKRKIMPIPKFKIVKNQQNKFEVYYVENNRLIPYITWTGLDKVYAFTSLEIAKEELRLENLKNTYYVE